MSPNGRSVYVANSGFADTVSQYNVGATGRWRPKSPATVAAGDRPLGVAVSPDGRASTSANTARQRLPIQRRRGRRARRRRARRRWPPARPDRGGGEPGRGERLRHEHTSDNVSQYDVGAGGTLRPKSPATVAAGGGPVGVAVSPDGQSVYVTNHFSDNVSQYNVGAGGALPPRARPRWAPATSRKRSR